MTLTQSLNLLQTQIKRWSQRKCAICEETVTVKYLDLCQFHYRQGYWQKNKDYLRKKRMRYYQSAMEKEFFNVYGRFPTENERKQFKPFYHENKRLLKLYSE